MRRALVLALLASLAPIASGGWLVNLADNPSAERDANRDGVPDGWLPMPYRSPVQPAWDKAVAHSGRSSLRLSSTTVPSGKSWNENVGRWVGSKRRKVTPGKTYTLAVWVKTRGVSGSASACIAWWARGSWLAESYTKKLSGTNGWSRLVVSAVAPPKADAAQVYLGLSHGKGTAWFDDAVMVEGRSLPANFKPLDISAACNTGFRDEEPGDGQGGWTDQGPNDLRSLRPGLVTLRGVPFRILDPATSDGKSCIVLRGKGRESFPLEVELAVGRKCDTLYFLHCCAWASDGASAGRYELVFEDGKPVSIPLVCGRQIIDWWNPADTRECAVGWEGKNAECPSVGLAIFHLRNPRPDVAIKSIRFVSAGGPPVPILVAVTTADGPPVLTDRQVRYEFTDTTGWYAFDFPLDDVNLDSIDLTGFLDPPAGKHGFLTVRPDGHFYFADGTRARFFGTNVGGGRAFPEKAQAGTLAARLAKYGVNLLRIHAIDSRWSPLIDYARGDSRRLNPQALDRLDFFFAELKKRGIYVYFDMLDYRRFMPADGVPHAAEFQHGWQNSAKGATIYDDRLIELQKEFATNFFTHRNPYSGLRYCDDPAVAVVETTNENSVFYFRNTRLTLPYYLEELRSRWNRWLLERYGGRAALARAWTNANGECALLANEDPAKATVVLPMRHLYQEPTTAPFVGERSPARVNAMVRFFFELERRYYAQMRAHLRKIGIKVPITGTNQTFCPASNYADAVNDFMSRNNYWCHPNVHAKPFVTFRNLSVLRSDLARTANPVTEVASSTVAGKPMIVPEFNFPWPNEYRAEGLPLMVAYACLQDWDGLLFFAYNPERHHLEHFGNQSDPVRWGEFPAAAMMFHRRDVATARNEVHIGWPERQVFTARPSHRLAKSSPFRHFTYISRVRNAYYRERYRGKARLVEGASWKPHASKRYASDTAELTLDTTRGLFTINTPRTKGAVGFLGEAGPVKLGGMRLQCSTPFAAVLVTSLDGKPIGQSRRLLVTAVARAENTGQAFARNRSAIAEVGKPPVLAEPVDCRLVLPPGPCARVYPLDPTGKRRAALTTGVEDGRLVIETREARSPWLEVVGTPK